MNPMPFLREKEQKRKRKKRNKQKGRTVGLKIK